MRQPDAWDHTLATEDFVVITGKVKSTETFRKFERVKSVYYRVPSGACFTIPGYMLKAPHVSVGATNIEVKRSFTHNKDYLCGYVVEKVVESLGNNSAQEGNLPPPVDK